MKIPVQSILFRKLQNSNAGMFLRQNRGEQDLRFGAVPAIDEFVAGCEPVPVNDETAGREGWAVRLHLEPVTGPDPVSDRDLVLRYWGTSGSRARTYYISSQHSRPYDLWKPARARPGANVPGDLVGDVALVVKDVHGRLHGRWVRRENLGRLPNGLQAAIDEKKVGVYTVPDAGGGASPQVVRIIHALRLHHNVLLYGPPGTGKTHLVTEVRRHFGSSDILIDTETETESLSEFNGNNVLDAWATFHQSYSYEDFLIGLRPKPLPNGGFDLVPRAGILLELAEWSRKAGNSSLIIIDEINRGNVSRIFGEFITLMEPDKRLDDDGAPTNQTIDVRLPFVDGKTTVLVDLPDGSTATVPTPFTMPRRLYTLATMNSVDKSVAPLDAALRRRFHVVDVAPRLDEFRARLGLDNRPLTSDLVPQKPETLEDARWLGLALLHVLNNRITLFLGPDHQLGEWFLAPLVRADTDEDGLAALADLWRNSVMPQLEDYFVGRADQLAKVLGDPVAGEPALVIDEPTPAYLELGAERSIRARPEADSEALLLLMAKIVRLGVPTASNPER